MKPIERALANAPPNADSSRLEDAMCMADLVQLASRGTPGPNSCLARSLTLVAMMRRRQLAGRLCIGVRLERGRLEAHAWVEYCGVPINDRADIAGHYTALTDPLSFHGFSPQ
jgi:hypothetical protein